MARPITMTDVSQDESAGGRLVATDGRVLPLTSVRLTADARGGVARAVLVQAFRNVHPDPLQVTYQLPLPHGGAVSGFAFRLGGRRIVGEVDLVRNARERFEQAVVEGRSAALLEQQRGSVFTQEIGNVPPGAEIEAELTIDQKLDWRDEGAWEWRFPTALAPRYQGGPGRVSDTARTAVEIADGPLAARLALSLAIRDTLAPGKRPESPSHALAFIEESGLLKASLRDDRGVPLDRDVVIRWPVAAPAVGLALDPFRPDGGRLGDGRAFGLLTVVPPSRDRAPRPVPRDLIVLLDTSGSMQGEPLDQERRIVGALIDSLEPQDRLELVEFSTSARRWRRGAAEATASSRADARRWLGKLQAGGGTEMREGIREALRGLRPEAQRQVVLVTDGLIGFEEEVIAEILATLPPGSRLHTVGVGSAVNRSLTGPAARAGRGLEVIVGLGEDPERAATALRARTAAPLVTGIKVEGSALVAQAPARLPDLFAGAPALVSLELRPEGGVLTVRGSTAEGPFERRVEVRPMTPGAGSVAVAALFAREAVEDLEMRLAAGEEPMVIDRRVEELGLAFQISTRLTSWVAVSEEATVDPSRPIRRERMPGELPHGLSVEGLGLRRAAPSVGQQFQLASAIVSHEAALPAPTAKTRGVLGAGRPPAARAPTPSMPRKYKRVRLFEKATRGEEGESEAGPTRTLGAILRLARKGELVLEVSVTIEPLAWDPPATVTVELDDGSVEEADVDRKQTTATAQIGAQQSLRLVLRAPAIVPGRIARILLQVRGTTLVLDVQQ